MALGIAALTATLDSSGRWVTLTATCTGAIEATVYRVTADGNQAVRGAFQKAVSGVLVAADYEAPQNTTLTYFARVTDGTSTKDSALVTPAGVVDRGGDVVFGLTNPLAVLPINVQSIPELRSEASRDVVKVIGRSDPIVVSDTRQYPSGTLSLITLTDGERNSLNGLLAAGSVLAFSAYDPGYGFADVWYFSVGAVTERRPSPKGSEPSRVFDLEVQRVAPPPADFIGPAFTTWQQVLDSGTTWGEAFAATTTWLMLEVA